MPFSERMMKVLYENLPAFADKLCINEVYAAFECIIINVKKLIKPDAMATLEEFEAKVKEVSPFMNPNISLPRFLSLYS
ncbi:unnamed protein product [Trichobilharzia regenti]|nr:unnamed protein product [Trichobilharzia regenti]